MLRKHQVNCKGYSTKCCKKKKSELGKKKRLGEEILDTAKWEDDY